MMVERVPCCVACCKSEANKFIPDINAALATEKRSFHETLQSGRLLDRFEVFLALRYSSHQIGFEKSAFCPILRHLTAFMRASPRYPKHDP